MGAKARRARLACSAIALFAASTSGASGPTPAFPAGIQPMYREIGDWIVACDNTRRCVAKYMLDDAEDRTSQFDDDAGLRVEREAGPAAFPRFTATAGSAFHASSIEIDGRAAPHSSGWASRDKGQEATLVGPDALGLIRTMRDARVLAWPAEAGSTKISLMGLAAILLAIDDVQGRIGSVGAFTRTGAISAPVVPSAILPPIVTPGPRAMPLRDPAALIRTLRRLRRSTLKSHECDQEPGTNDSANALNDETTLVLLGCGRFAYQTSVLAFLVPKGKPELARPLIVGDPVPEAQADAESLGEYVGGSYDPERQVFSMYAKGRGLADCGTSAEWTYDGRAFRLSSYATQQRCGGEPGDWLTLFRTRSGSGP